MSDEKVKLNQGLENSDDKSNPSFIVLILSVYLSIYLNTIMCDDLAYYLLYLLSLIKAIPCHVP